MRERYSPSTSSFSTLSTPLLRKIVENPFFLAFWIIVLTFFSTHFIHSALVRRTAIKEKERQEQLLKFEEERGLRLMKELENAQSDFAKEKIIRDELHMQKPGETILQLPPSPTP